MAPSCLFCEHFGMGIPSDRVSPPQADIDAVQMAAARQAGADYLVTRDRAGYAAGPLPALAPAELLALLPDLEEQGCTS